MKIGDQKLPEIIVWFGGSIGGVSEIGVWLFLNFCSFPTGCSREFDSWSLPRAHTLKQKRWLFHTHRYVEHDFLLGMGGGSVLCVVLHHSQLGKKVTESSLLQWIVGDGFTLTKSQGTFSNKFLEQMPFRIGTDGWGFRWWSIKRHLSGIEQIWVFDRMFMMGGAMFVFAFVLGLQPSKEPW